MKNRCITCFIILALLLSYTSALSENKLFRFVYGNSNTKYKLEWGSNIDQLQNGGFGFISKSSFHEVQIPFWSDITKLSSEKIGYSFSKWPVNFTYLGIDIEDVELFYYCGYNEFGNFDESHSQLYMVKMRVSPNENAWFKNHLNDIKKTFGTPKLKETSESQFAGAMLQIGRYVMKDGIDYTLYHRTYTWSGSDNTGMHIMLDYNDHTKEYSNIVIYIGKTDKDFLLSQGNYKINTVTAGSQITVEKKRIALRDENNKIIQKLEVGTKLLIIGYDAKLDMFAAIVGDGNSNTEEKAAKGDFDGYVHGDNLSVSRAELLEKYKK